VSDAERQQREPAVALDDLGQEHVLVGEILLQRGDLVLGDAVVDAQLGQIGFAREQLPAAGLGITRHAHRTRATSS
jgi:hypothetical protein